MRERITKQIPTNEQLPSFTQSEIKNEGKVYTPLEIVNDIVNRYSSLLIQSKKICDPSVGQGNFLRILFQKFLNEGHTPDKAFANLYGYDIDHQAINNARRYFTDNGVNLDLVNTNLTCVDAVELTPSLNCVYDIVIGNPPYVRSPKNVPPNFKLRSNLVDVFFEIAIDILKPDGTLIYIVQDSFLTNEDNTLRNFLVGYNIKTLETRYDYSKKFREFNVAVDICLVEIQKNDIQNEKISVWKHQPFVISKSLIVRDKKWNIFPQRVVDLNNILQSFPVALTDEVNVTKGRTENSNIKIPKSYSSTTYSKIQTEEFCVGVLGEPDLDYFFPKQPIIMSNFTKATLKQNDDVDFHHFIALPYFTSKFRFCLIERDLLTTPLVYILSDSQKGDMRWILPLLNNSVTDFQIRYNTKSRDTGYEFKQTTFSYIKFPDVDEIMKQQLCKIAETVRRGLITHQQCDEWVCEFVYKLSEQQMTLIGECKSYWFKKHVKTVKHIPSPL